LESGYTKEEMKMVNETKKIMRAPDIKLTATAVRVPVVGGHSESVNVEFENPYELADIYRILKQTPGVIVTDEPANNLYPMPIHAEGKDEVFVGRIRRDDSIANGLNMWIVADNLRKGAATNAVQIAQYLIKNKLV
jgi:aspartate-semialdehyde dehydrogenase